MVLLKNTGGILPLNAAKIHSIAVIGPGAKGMQFDSAGSPGVQPFYTIEPLAEIQTRVGSAVTVNYAAGQSSGIPVPRSALSSALGSGLRGEYFTNRNLSGQPLIVRADAPLQFDWSQTAPTPQMPRTEFSVRWTGMLTAPATGEYALSLTGDDGYRLFLDGKPLIDHWFEGGASTVTIDVDLKAGQSHDLRIEYFQAGGDALLRFNWTLPGQFSYAEAADAARSSDVAVVVVTTAGTEGEGQDRPSMALPANQDKRIQAVVAANPKTIVVLNNGTPVLMPWLSSVPGLVEAWFPGDEGGHALASLLFGDLNPSGKLPTTLGSRREDYPDYGNFPGKAGQVTYAEGIYVGYRHFDKKNIAPLFPFGYGLSYTTFRYSNLRFSHALLMPSGSVTASVAVTNTGQREGAEVAGLYVHDPAPKIDKPIRELKGFGKVDLLPGQTKIVTMMLHPRDFAYCDVAGKQWRADAGTYDIEVGASSRDIRQRAALRLTATYTKPIPLLGDEPAPIVRNVHDLAYKRPVTASSVQEADTVAKNVNDGDDSTRWGSDFSEPQWIAVDLGKTVSIDHVKLLWEDAYASAYSIQISPDGKNYTDVYTTQNDTGDPETIKFAPVSTRYVRLYATRRATKFGVSVFSFEVYAPGT
jgi:beta-glucosidase